MAQERDAGAQLAQWSEEADELNCVTESLFGVSDDAASVQVLSAPDRRFEQGTRQAAVGNLPATLEILPAFHVPAMKQHERTAMIFCIRVFGIARNRFVISDQAFLVPFEVEQ